jgi:penicillin-binding protein 1A
MNIFTRSFRWTKTKLSRLSRLTWLTLFSLLVIASGITFLWIAVSHGLPTLDQLENPHPEVATRIISSDGESIDQYYIKNRTTVHLRDVPPFLINGLISTEDRDFFGHWGVNFSRNLGAAWTDIVTLSPRQGASTITQQLARNLYLSQEKSILRKLRELVSAVQIERTHTKREILEMYLNVAYMGRGAYGVGVAAQVYFGKDVSKLTPAECAYLVGVLKGPENYDPEDNYDHAIARRNTVIENMVDNKMLSADLATKYKAEPLKVVVQRGYQGIAPHFVEMIRQDLSRRPELQGYDLYRDGLVVYATLNAVMQRAANRAVLEHVADYQKRVVEKRWNWAAHKPLLDSLVSRSIRANVDFKLSTDAKARRAIEKKLRASTTFVDSVKKAELRMQVGFVCLDQTSGQILAMVGSSNFREQRYGLNHATQIVRQPGSSFKPIIYASCFEQGATPETQISNEPISMPDGDRVWSPGNFEGESTGGTRSIRTALQYSINLCAIHAMLEVTSTQDVIRMAKRLGIRSNIPAYPSIALGSAEVSPIELTSAYSTFANDGIRATPYAILRVEDRNGKVLYRSRPEFENVLEPKIARMMTSCLADVVDRGTASRIRGQCNFHFPAAGKTGTTQNYEDAWFVGYTPLFTAGVWVGFDDKRISFTAGADGQGGRAAAPIWGYFMKYTYDALKPKITYFSTHYVAAVSNATEKAASSDSGEVTKPINTVPDRVPVLKPVKPQPVVPRPAQTR